ncbi:hypothetical protein DH2020_037986 [Rehmannia glutinosa]|uniref:Peroxidase n=1 Tax=Rehmannia glutinosa TaxID=99300 RepID=A0ABR0UZV3_REHGL
MDMSGKDTNIEAKEGSDNHDTFTSKLEELTQANETIDENKLYLDVVGGANRNGTYGLGSEAFIIASPNNDAEKDAPDNLSLAGDGFDTVVKAKQAVQAQCPGIAGGPAYNVELGRRIGLISQASRVSGNLPEPDFNLIQLNTMFAKNNLSQTDMIALSGCHTLGFSHCSRFANRIYSFSPSNPVDPTLDPSYAQQLMQECPQNVDPQIAINMDPVTPQTFDNVYFQNLVGGKGLFTSDQVLFTDPASQSTVTDFAKNTGDFNGAFITAMTKLGRVGVKTGSQGEIRRDCTAFNS